MRRAGGEAEDAVGIGGGVLVQVGQLGMKEWVGCYAFQFCKGVRKRMGLGGQCWYRQDS